MKKKGQAAMEFLMTYGWAILAAIIVIGVLAVYFRPSSLTSDSAIVTAPFYALGSTISASQVQLEIQNNGGETLNVTGVTIDVSTPAAAVCGNQSYVGNVAAGGTTTATFTCSSGISSGDSFSADVIVNYVRPGSSLILSSSGTISGTAA